MGYGDEIMATAEIRRAFQKVNRPVLVGNGNRIEWSELWEHNPKVTKEVTKDAVWVHNYGGNRPYIDNSKTTPEKFWFRDTFKAEPGELFLKPKEVAKWSHLKGSVYIEPNVKGSFGGNKDWGFDRWQSVVDALPQVRFVQGPGRGLRGVEQLQTVSIRDACGALSNADLFIGTDGALHHAAAALGKRAVVVWGGLVTPNILGYDSHTNLWSGAKWCGSVKSCSHCRKALDWVTPEKVIDAIDALRNLESYTTSVPEVG